MKYSPCKIFIDAQARAVRKFLHRRTCYLPVQYDPGHSKPRHKTLGSHLNPQLQVLTSAFPILDMDLDMDFLLVYSDCCTGEFRDETKMKLTKKDI